jgi:hypothetical protein
MTDLRTRADKILNRNPMSKQRTTRATTNYVPSQVVMVKGYPSNSNNPTSSFDYHGRHVIGEANQSPFKNPHVNYFRQEESRDISTEKRSQDRIQSHGAGLPSSIHSFKLPSKSSLIAPASFD